MSAIIETWGIAVDYVVDETITTSTNPSVAPQYQNKTFRAKAAHTSTSFATDFGNDLWEEILSKGIEGPQGVQGPNGNNGADGATGPQGPNGADGADGIFSQIATTPEAQAGVDDTKGMTPAKTKDAIDAQVAADRADIITNANDIAQNVLDIAQNASDIAGIVIDSAQITTNQNDIAGNVLDIAQNAADIAAIVIDNAQIATNQADINTINTVDLPALVDEVNKLKARMTVLEATNLFLNRATGKQRLQNNFGPQDILGSDLPGEAGRGNRFELDTEGARSARVHVEIYRKDDAEVRFTTCVLLLHFIPGINTWVLERESTTPIVGGDDGVTFNIVTTPSAPGEFLGTVQYTTNDMVGGNYDIDSYVKFLLEEIKDTF